MRVLHINSTIYINSGVMSVLMNYYRNIDREKVQFDFLYFIKPGADYKTYQEEIEELGGRVFFIPDFKNFVVFNKQLEGLLEEHPEYDTVHIHDPFVVQFIYRTLRKHGVNNIIVHSHATQWSDKKVSGIRNRLVCINLKKHIDYSFACSRAAGEFLYGKNSDFMVVNNAIDVERYHFDAVERKKLRKELGIERNIVFGHVGNFNNQKNHTFLIDIFSEIIHMCPDATLLLIGDGMLKGKIFKKVEKLGLTNKVYFLGKKSDVEHYYSAMDCMILPSLYEGLPMVGVESQCSGLPTLMSDTITREVGLVTYDFMSLSDSPFEWAKQAIKLAATEDFERSDAARIIEEKGFSIQIEAAKLAAAYKGMSVK